MNGTAPRDTAIERERAHEDGWYARALRERFFERPGFDRLVTWNLAALARAVPLGPSTRLLSIGSGLGDYEIALARRVARVTGVELSPLAVAEAQRRAAAAGLSNATFLALPIDEFDAPPGSFDLVYAMGVFHHVPSSAARVAILSRALAWLRPGGHVYVRDPSRLGLPRRLGYRLARAVSAFHSPNEDHLDPRQSANEVRQAGFAHVRVDYTDVLMGPLPWVAGSLPGPFWSAVAAFDRLWLATPYLRERASQFAVIGVRR